MNRGHYQRMSQSVVHYPKSLCEEYQVRSYEEVVENGRVLKRTVWKTVDPREVNAGVRVSDFCMENIIAAGAYDSLKNSQVSLGTLEANDNVDAQLSAIDGAIAVDAAQNQTVSE